MKYLAIDASTEACSVAVKTENQVFEHFELCPQSHSLRLLPLVDQLLNQANLSLTSLDGLVFGRGPGSFTGIRIGIGVAQGLGFSANLPMVGVSTLAAMAKEAIDNHDAKVVVAAIDARMSEVYLGAYSVSSEGKLEAIIEECVVSPENASSIIQSLNLDNAMAVGTGWDAYQDKLNLSLLKLTKSEINFPRASAMLALAEDEFAAGNVVEAEKAEPVYVRDTVSWQKLPGR